MTLIENTDLENGIHSSEIIAMAWDDDTSFEAIKSLTGLTEKEVISLMRKSMKPSSFRMWRKRVAGRKTKHEALLGLTLQEREV